MLSRKSAVSDLGNLDAGLFKFKRLRVLEERSSLLDMLALTAAGLGAAICARALWRFGPDDMPFRDRELLMDL